MLYIWPLLACSLKSANSMSTSLGSLGSFLGSSGFCFALGSPLSPLFELTLSCSIPSRNVTSVHSSLASNFFSGVLHVAHSFISRDHEDLGCTVYFSKSVFKAEFCSSFN